MLHPRYVSLVGLHGICLAGVIERNLDDPFQMWKLEPSTLKTPAKESFVCGAGAKGEEW